MSSICALCEDEVFWRCIHTRTNGRQAPDGAEMVDVPNSKYGLRAVVSCPDYQEVKHKRRNLNNGSGASVPLTVYDENMKKLGAFTSIRQAHQSGILPCSDFFLHGLNGSGWFVLWNRQRDKPKWYYINKGDLPIKYTKENPGCNQKTAAVAKLDKDGSILEWYSSMKQAATANGICNGTLGYKIAVRRFAVVKGCIFGKGIDINLDNPKQKSEFEKVVKDLDGN